MRMPFRLFPSLLPLLLLGLALPCSRAADPMPFPALPAPDNDHTPPKLLQRVEPVYPAGVSETKDRRVYVAFLVAADGRVRNASALFAPPTAFAHAAVAAIEQWVFEPGQIRNGPPVSTQMTVELWFKPAAIGPHDPAIVQAVLAANAALTDASNRLDTDAFFAGIFDSDETRIIQDGKLFKTRTEAMAVVRRGSQGIAKLERRFDDPHVSVLAPGVALFTAEGTTALTRQDGRSFSGPFAVSLLFVLRDGQWKVFHGHYSQPNPAP